MSTEREPTVEEGRLLQNLDAGVPEYTNFANQAEGLRAMFACVSAGWVSGGRLTAAGRALLGKPRKTHRFEITILKDGGV